MRVTGSGDRKNPRSKYGTCRRSKPALLIGTRSDSSSDGEGPSGLDPPPVATRSRNTVDGDDVCRVAHVQLAFVGHPAHGDVGSGHLIHLSWDPITIEPDTNTKFIFTIRDGTTGQPLRNSDYTFVLLQGGKEIHRTTGLAQIGGESEDYYFAEDQTGSTIVRFENIRNTGQETEFGIVVAPEFGSIAALILIVSIMTVIIISKKTLFTLKTF